MKAINKSSNKAFAICKRLKSTVHVCFCYSDFYYTFKKRIQHLHKLLFEPRRRLSLCMCKFLYEMCTCFGLLWAFISNAETSNNRILSIPYLCMKWHYKRSDCTLIQRDSKSLVDMNRHANFLMHI